MHRIFPGGSVVAVGSVVAGVDAVVGGAVYVNSECSGAAGVDAVVVGAVVVGVVGVGAVGVVAEGAVAIVVSAADIGPVGEDVFCVDAVFAGVVEHGVAGGRGVVGDSKWLMLRFNESAGLKQPSN